MQSSALTLLFSFSSLKWGCLHFAWLSSLYASVLVDVKRTFNRSTSGRLMWLHQGLSYCPKTPLFPALFLLQSLILSIDMFHCIKLLNVEKIDISKLNIYEVMQAFNECAKVFKALIKWRLIDGLAISELQELNLQSASINNKQQDWSTTTFGLSMANCYKFFWNHVKKGNAEPRDNSCLIAPRIPVWLRVLCWVWLAGLLACA